MAFEILAPNFLDVGQQALAQGKSVTFDKYAELHCHPRLFLENALGDVKEQITYSTDAEVASSKDHFRKN